MAERLKTAMAARNLSGAQLSKLVSAACGSPISQVAIQKITSGKTLHSKRLPDIAKTLGVSVEWLAFGESSSRNPESSTTLVAVRDTTAQSSNTDMEERKLKKGLIPVVGTYQLGSDGYFTAVTSPAGHQTGNLHLHSDDPDAYGIRLLGDSMSPRIKHGEYVVVEPNQRLVEHEEVLVIMVDGRQMIRLFSGLKDGFYRFESINEKHGPIHIAADAIDKIHYVAGILKGTRYFEP